QPSFPHLSSPTNRRINRAHSAAVSLR
ncbi:hypothetical protein CSUI_007410, partial [Cystoisospora suis]